MTSVRARDLQIDATRGILRCPCIQPVGIPEKDESRLPDPRRRKGTRPVENRLANASSEALLRDGLMTIPEAAGFPQTEPE